MRETLVKRVTFDMRETEEGETGGRKGGVVGKKAEEGEKGIEENGNSLKREADAEWNIYFYRLFTLRRIKGKEFNIFLIYYM